jgi:hypothetical protein
MPHYVVYTTATGAEFSSGSSIAETLPDHLSVVTFATAPDRSVVMWDAATLDFVPRPPHTTSVISRQTFMDRLGATCTVGMQIASVTFPTDDMPTQVAKAGLRDVLLRFQIVQEIDLADPRTIGNVDALIAGGLLAGNRRDIVLAPVVL